MILNLIVHAAIFEKLSVLFDFDKPDSLFIFVQLVASLSCMIVSVLLPRRPDVFRAGKTVDGQYTTSWLGRISLSWAKSVLEFAVKKKTLEIHDLPVLHHSILSKQLRMTLDDAFEGAATLWKALLSRYRPVLTLQICLAFVSSGLNLSPQFCLLQILQTLEERDSGSHNPTKAWIWVLMLGVSIFVNAVLDSLLYWLLRSNLGIPIHEQLSAYIFAKSMRRKDTKGVRKPPQAANGGANAQSPKRSQKSENDDDKDARKSRQETINLAAVDAKRVSDFFAFNYFIPKTLIQLTMSYFFLYRLIGWKSLGAGLLASMATTPLNTVLARRYATAQSKLMRSRDQKMAVITEVFQGIRQIKFSALEEQWELKILEKRNEELKAQWSAFIHQISVASIWLLSPLLLSAVSLGAYTILHGELKAHTAFTSISIFSTIEFSLAIIPEMITEFVDAWVSMKRIDKYLNSEDKAQDTLPGNEILFEKAVISWPVESREELRDGFILKNINLEFPKKALSVISGKTGSGKSLLLASILGESEILDGVIRVPRSPSLEERFNERATKENWIIDSAIAFVPQIPWIENASIRDNIIFGLPFDRERYERVLLACALEKDLKTFVDGDLTDIGANGVNLSGGQKWRVSFARALYSRAGILIMDDLFSAVDAHTGRHLYNHALTGKMGQGRTRILVTHHISLCLEQTDYLVHLRDGTVEYAGSVDELKQMGTLSGILSQEANEKSNQVETSEDGSSETNDETDFHRVSQSKSGSRTIRTGEQPEAKAPKKFQQDETRNTGSIKYINYTRYFRSGGSIVFWLSAGMAFCVFVVLSIGRVRTLVFPRYFFS